MGSSSCSGGLALRLEGGRGGGVSWLGSLLGEAGWGVNGLGLHGAAWALAWDCSALKTAPPALLLFARGCSAPKTIPAALLLFVQGCSALDRAPLLPPPMLGAWRGSWPDHSQRSCASSSYSADRASVGE